MRQTQWSCLTSDNRVATTGSSNKPNKNQSPIGREKESNNIVVIHMMFQAAVQ